MLIFDTRFIEVRHVETGRLAQIIPGDAVRCIYDGRYGLAEDITATMDEQEARVHAVMNVYDDIGGNRTGAAVQKVVELIPSSGWKAVPPHLP